MDSQKSSNVIWHAATVTRQRREILNGHPSILLWFTGLSGSGKSTISHAVEEQLHQQGLHTFVLDGDNVRHGLCSDLGFSHRERSENIRRIGETAKLFLEAGVIVLAAFISPFQAYREKIRELAGEDSFIEIYCRCPLEVCEQREVKGHYRRARAGEIKDFTGISSPYEEPSSPNLIIDTAASSPEQCVEDVLSLLSRQGIILRNTILQ